MNIVNKEPILEGWSSDKKYCITDEKGTRFLLRISDIKQYDTKQSEFVMMQRVAALGIPMCLPIEFGICEEGVYSIQSWIDGESAEDLILCIIDFNRNDYGDPWEEFNRIVWCAQKSPHFASGMVNGYFDNEIPRDFWKLLALYISSNALSSVYWDIPFGESEVETMINQAEEVVTWYDEMTNPIPTWYIYAKT
ncbi:MAG: hypothetical protein IJ608_04450 [Lachnospiraceae bacterium]|nr:hypothetical protein [Lachnospiraceae bacterium]